MDNKKLISAKVIVKFAKSVAKLSNGAASMWSIYQPQQPQKKDK